MLIGAVLGCGIVGAVVVSRLTTHAVQSELFTVALRAFSRAPSVRIRGSTMLDGSVVELDVVAGAQTGGGTVAVGPAACQVVFDGPTLYVDASALTWQELGEGSDVPALADRWLSTSLETRPFSTFGEFVSTTAFASLLGTTPPLVEGSPMRFHGARVIPLRSTDGGGMTIYVTTSRVPSLVAEEGPAGWINFDEYGSARAPLVPTGAVAISSLGPIPG